MRLTKIRSMISAVAIGIAGMYALFGLLGSSPVLAHGLEVTEHTSLALLEEAQANDEPASFVTVSFADEGGSHDIDNGTTSIRSPNILLPLEGKHRGGLRCEEGVCSQQTELQLMSASPPLTVTYSFESLQAAYPGEEKVVVAGTGVMSWDGQTTEFRFEASFWNNGDGTISTRYDADAAHPEASFIIPRTSGSMLVTGYDFLADASHAD